MVMLVLKYDDLRLSVGGPLKFVRMSDKDDIYENLLFVRESVDSTSFESLIDTLLGKGNIDNLSKETALRFIRENTVVTRLHVLKEMKAELDSLPDDADTFFRVTGFSSRGSNARSPFLLQSLSETILVLEDSVSRAIISR